MIPKPLSHVHACHRQAFENACLHQKHPMPDAPDFQAALDRALCSSEFISMVFQKNPHWAQDIFFHPNFSKMLKVNEYRQDLSERLSSCETQAQLMKHLRQFRNYHMARIAWKNILSKSTLLEELAQLSALAEVCIQQTVLKLYQWLIPRMGAPLDAQQNPQQLIVVAMGKLGGKELNFSSDVDLIFAFEHSGVTEKKIHNAQFFSQLGQQLIHVLSLPNEDGFVFRVDMRLRPYGQSGPLAFSFAALETYYQVHGRDWERYAMVKARAITGSPSAQKQLMTLLRPFVYRRYLDYGAFQALREMKDWVKADIKRRGLENDLKLGPGGIRQIEFITQAFQLLRGGRHPQYQQVNLLKALSQLTQDKLIAPQAAEQLTQAYCFLRKAEHALQILKDEQTHVLPIQSQAQHQVSYILGCAHWAEVMETLSSHRQRVLAHFKRISAAPPLPQGVRDHPSSKRLSLIWHNLENKEVTTWDLKKVGFSSPEVIWEHLSRFKQNPTIRSLKSIARQRLDRVLPAFLGLLLHEEKANEVLSRMLRLFLAICRRSVYLVHLIEHPNALQRLITLCALSHWMADKLSAFPVLFDEILNPKLSLQLPSETQLRQELHERMRWISGDDLEQKMEHLRQFKWANVVKVAMIELLGHQENMQLNQCLSYIAQVILEKVYSMALAYMNDRFGPLVDSEQRPQMPQFIVVAYGNLGALELNYGSDLDLVFLYQQGDFSTNGENALSASEYYLRLAQRMIHILSTQTLLGHLYDIDVRLRPDGASGLLVSPFLAYQKYMELKAWTWEHQALVRARVVCGAHPLRDAFNQLKSAIFTLPRSWAALNTQVLEMRQKCCAKVKASLDVSQSLKWGPGGLQDIEFMMQYCVLRWAGTYDALRGQTSSLTLLDTCITHHILSLYQGNALKDAYFFIHDALRKHSLQKTLSLTQHDQLAVHMQQVRKIWDHWFEAHTVVK